MRSPRPMQMESSLNKQANPGEKIGAHNIIRSASSKKIAFKTTKYHWDHCRSDLFESLIEKNRKENKSNTSQ